MRADSLAGATGPGAARRPARERPPAVPDLDSAAPVVGSVQPLPVHRLGVATVHRPPAVAIDSVRSGDLHVAGASLIGLGHVVAGGVRQDAYGFVATAGGSLAVAVADGLGSRALSQLGASFFCTGVMQAAAGGCTSAAALVRSGSDYAATAAKRLYQLKAADIAFVAAVAVFAPPAPDGARGADIARVGDVSAFALGDGELTELFAADDEPVNVVHAALPGAAEPEVTRSAAAVIAVATDGLAVDLRTSPGIQKWLSARWTAPLGPYAFADTLRYQRQGSHDDRTAVVIWRLTDDQAVDAGAGEQAGAAADGT